VVWRAVRDLAYSRSWLGRTLKKKTDKFTHIPRQLNFYGLKRKCLACLVLIAAGASEKFICRRIYGKTCFVQTVEWTDCIAYVHRTRNSYPAETFRCACATSLQSGLFSAFQNCVNVDMFFPHYTHFEQTSVSEMLEGSNV
jgi:hypothetical protein